MATVLPIEQDRIRSKCARTYRRVAPSPRVLAAALKLNPSQGTRLMQGESAAYRKIIEHIEALTRHPETTPFPFIVEIRGEYMLQLLKERSNKWLIRRWHELRDREPILDAEEELASRRPDRAAYRAALIAEAEAQIELAMIDELLEQRKIEPRHFRGDGYPLNAS